MKTIQIFLVALCGVLFIQCSKDSNDPEKPGYEKNLLQVEIGIDGLTKSSNSGVRNSFLANDKVGLFITNGTVGQPYGGLATNSNVGCSYISSKWQLERNVYLSNETALVYAYYPYNSAVTNIQSVPVTTDGKVDYMYGTHANSTVLNNKNPNIALKMKHALSSVQFYIKKENYPGAGKVTKLEISNQGEKKLFVTQGTLNAVTGLITPSATAGTLALTDTNGLIASLDNDFGDNEIELMIIPVTEKTKEKGEIVISITIDGTVYKWSDLPVGTNWAAGTRNVYEVTLKGTELETGGSTSITIDNWVVEDKDEFVIK